MSAEGLLVVHKPSGPTSHDIVAQARRVYRTRAVGHAGTLDPMASGVLVLLFGEATKLAPYLTAGDKEYRAELELGRSTDTLDALGQVTEQRELTASWLSNAELERALGAERERTLQVPPAFSAVSVGGVRAYQRARKGQALVLPARHVRVHSLEVVSVHEHRLVVRMTVSKGYYVRAFARDVASSLGVPGHLAALERLSSGPFKADEAVPWPPPSEAPAPIPLSAAACRVLPAGSLTDIGAQRARCGQPLVPEHFSALPEEPSLPFLWVDPAGTPVAIGRRAEDGALRVARGFRQQ